MHQLADGVVLVGAEAAYAAGVAVALKISTSILPSAVSGATMS